MVEKIFASLLLMGACAVPSFGWASTWLPMVWFNHDRPAKGDTGLWRPAGAALVLEDVVQRSAAYPALRFDIVGHADNTGDDAYNMALSKRRAEVVKAMLVQRGIAPERLTVIAKGKRELLVPTPLHTPEPQNRRVEIRPK